MSTDSAASLASPRAAPGVARAVTPHAAQAAAAAEPAARECAHCGLPLPRRPVAGEIEGASLRFCCTGCWIAMGVTRSRGEAGGAAAMLVRLGLGVFFAMNVMMLSAPSYVPHVYGTAEGALDGPLFVWLRWLAAAFSLPVLVLLGGPVAVGALSGLRGPRKGADALIALGVAAAYALSFANLLRGLPAVYFDTGAMLLVLVTLGRYLEARARADATAAVRAKLSPAGVPARLLRDGVARDLDPRELAPGDLVEVGVGTAIPTDGVVERGSAGVDESMLTGESAVVLKEPGDAVAGGTCSVDGRLEVRVTACVGDSAAARIEALLAGAWRERSRAERIADAAAAALLPLLLAVAVGAGAWWGLHAGLDRGVLVAVAVVVVACPCALGIATPVAIWVALQTAARRGVVVRSAPALERLADVGEVVFDKTGTITDPLPAIASIEPAPGASLDAGELLRRCAALEAGMPHPLARAIVASARGAGAAPAGDASPTREPQAAELPEARDVRLAPGRGVEGVVAGRRLAVGSARFARERLADADAAEGLAAMERRASAGTSAFVVEDGRPLAAIEFVEAVRPSAREAVAALRRAGIPLRLLTGDLRADAVVPEVFALGEVALGLAPAGKVAHVRELRRSGARPRRAIAMVGDGINDAPALAAADVGIAVAGATDLARLTADAAVLGGDLRAVPWLLAHARRARAIARQNLAWAFGYNAIAVGLAAAGELSPLVASAAMIASSLAVVVNARRLARDPRRRGVPPAGAVSAVAAP